MEKKKVISHVFLFKDVFQISLDRIIKVKDLEEICLFH